MGISGSIINVVVVSISRLLSLVVVSMLCMKWCSYLCEVSSMVIVMFMLVVSSGWCVVSVFSVR